MTGPPVIAVIKFSAKPDLPDRAPPMTQAFFYSLGSKKVSLWIDPVTG
jgi:hypothetical protein